MRDSRNDLRVDYMHGISRVYKSKLSFNVFSPLVLTRHAVQHDIFYTDVNNCFVSLKKVIQDIQSSALGDAHFQMDHPALRPEALTLANDPMAALALELDPMVPFSFRFLTGTLIKRSTGTISLTVSKKTNIL